MPTRKNREPSKCREWERERRNRLNEAFAQLAVLLADHSTPRPPHGKGHTNLAKIEIVQTAIVVVKDMVLQKSQLDAKLLAAETEIKGYKEINKNTKDAFTQVYKQLSPRVMDCPKKKNLWRESVRKEKHASSKDTNIKEGLKLSSAAHMNLPKLLPKSSSKDKDAFDKRVVVLPAAPYILPQRPLVLPQPPPTLFVLEPFSGALRTNMPIVPRVVSEITKTTMVNNIPIAAYSFPLSVAKNKKFRSRDTKAGTKRSILLKRQLKVIKESKMNDKVNDKVCINKIDSLKESNDKVPLKNSSLPDNDISKNIPEKSHKEKDTPRAEDQPSENSNIKLQDNEDGAEFDDSNCAKVTENVGLYSVKNVNEDHDKEAEDKQIKFCGEVNKIDLNKPIAESENKNKDKIQSILDTTICDNTVDGGNARLELAEEFLAASPTAAFLMSFPLVSGLRADSPAEDEPHTLHPIVSAARAPHHKPETPSVGIAPLEAYFDKSTEMEKQLKKVNIIVPNVPTQFTDKQKLPEKTCLSNQIYSRQNLAVSTCNTGMEHSFLNLLPSAPVSTTVEPVFSLDFDGNFPKNSTTSHSYVNNNNILFKNDPFNGKNLYPSNSISAGHEYNSFGLYPCAVDKYSSKTNKAEYHNTEDSFMKIGSARLTYDLDLGLPQKPYEFTANANISNLSKENVITSATTFPGSSYNPFNPDLPVQFPTSSAINTSTKKINTKSNPFYTDTITNIYSQPSTLWPEEFNLYGNNNKNMPKTSNIKPQNYNTFSNSIVPINKYNKTAPVYDNKGQTFHSNLSKTSKHEVNQLITDKNNKKSPSKSHINWMTSEVRTLQNNSFDTVLNENKDSSRIQFPSVSNAALLPQLDYGTAKKIDYMDTNFFPISMPNITSLPNQEDIHMWPSGRPVATAEIGLDPPPINLPTLVGDLALGPHERRKSVDRANRNNVQLELPSCNSFLSVTQLMNRSTEPAVSRSHTMMNESFKPTLAKNEHPFTYPSVTMDKPALGHIDADNMQPCYFFSESKPNNTSETVPYNTSHNKNKSQKISERAKGNKNNYSAEALLKSANSGNSSKVTDNLSALKFTNTNHKYTGYNAGQEIQMAQVSHFPSIADYPDASYSQSYSGSGLYTSTGGGSLYGNLMTGGGGASSVPSAYAPPNFTPDFADYVPPPDCNFSYPRFDNFKIKNSSDTVPVKFPLDLPKTAATDTNRKHKEEYSRKDHSKKFSTKRPKMSSEILDWSEASDSLLHIKQSKRSSYNLTDEVTFSNYLMNQGSVYSHYTPLEPSTSIAVPPPSAAGRTAALCPTNAARTNFNLSTLFPEIAKKVQ